MSRCAQLPTARAGAVENETSISAEPYGKLTTGRVDPIDAGKHHVFNDLLMNRAILGVVVAFVVLLAAGVVFLGTYQQPPSTARMEVQVPNDRLSLQ